VGGSTLNLSLTAHCTVRTLFVLWNSTTHQLRCCEANAILHFTALWRRAGKLKISWVNVSAVPYLQKYSSKFWFYNYLKSRSVFLFTLYNIHILSRVWRKLFLVWFQPCAMVQMRSSLFQDVLQQEAVKSPTFRDSLMVPTSRVKQSYPQTLAANYQLTLRLPD